MKHVPAVFGIVFAAVLAAVIGVRLSPVGRAMVLGVIMGATTGTVGTFLVMVLVLGERKTNRRSASIQAMQRPDPDILFVAGEPTHVSWQRRLPG